tara:strand:- start:33 stop:821 length:789 start_codon:yes stop_codon:yes gene_type:complete
MNKGGGANQGGGANPYKLDERDGLTEHQLHELQRKQLYAHMLIPAAGDKSVQDTLQRFFDEYDLDKPNNTNAGKIKAERTLKYYKRKYGEKNYLKQLENDLQENYGEYVAKIRRQKDWLRLHGAGSPLLSEFQVKAAAVSGATAEDAFKTERHDTFGPIKVRATKREEKRRQQQQQQQRMLSEAADAATPGDHFDRTSAFTGLLGSHSAAAAEEEDALMKPPETDVDLSSHEHIADRHVSDDAEMKDGGNDRYQMSVHRRVF